ncbi:GNAT family N-acetyltransferase [Oryzibacter oryziterrae]|uniref:GNAT family N-acetyltransferase n=1 Tax=Oryzibacter oryziterrae TaxID=2766474 RepID=UPI001F17D8BB|nr:GNAT family N-acetyltransferase [Oryzibacter oryziterrae]
MMMIRPAQPKDIAAIAAIYAEAGIKGTASWELEAPDHAEMLRRFETITGAGFPYIVAELNGAVVGYAYANTYRPRQAYRFTVENSIYMDPAAQGRGIGKRLLKVLVDDCARRGFRQMIAVIGDSDNLASQKLHASLGFELVGIAKGLGYKHGRWLDQILMQRALGEGSTGAPAA